MRGRVGELGREREGGKRVQGRVGELGREGEGRGKRV